MSPDRAVASIVPERSALLSPLPVRRTLSRQVGSKPTSPPRGVVSTRLVRDIDRVERIERTVGTVGTVDPSVVVKVVAPMSPGKLLPARIGRTAVVSGTGAGSGTGTLAVRVPVTSAPVSAIATTTTTAPAPAPPTISLQKKMTLSLEGITLHSVKMVNDTTVVLSFTS